MICLTFSGSAADSLVATKKFVPSEGYASQMLEGWKLRVNKELLESQAELGGRTLALLAEKLREIRRLVPAEALKALQRVTIWVGVDDYALPNATYHPSAAWLREHGWNPDKAKGVEISNAATFLAWSADQPMMVLHELAHSYHDQVLGFENAEIRRVYEQAKASKRYEAVQRGDRRERAYALTDPQEFFAEASEAYFGRNDFQPFTREELRAFDPETFAVIEAAWGR